MVVVARLPGQHSWMCFKRVGTVPHLMGHAGQGKGGVLLRRNSAMRWAISSGEVALVVLLVLEPSPLLAHAHVLARHPILHGSLHGEAAAECRERLYSMAGAMCTS